MGAPAVLFLAAEGETTCETKYTGQSPQVLASSAPGKITKAKHVLEASYLLISPAAEPKTHTAFFFFFFFFFSSIA